MYEVIKEFILEIINLDHKIALLGDILTMKSRRFTPFQP